MRKPYIPKLLANLKTCNILNSGILKGPRKKMPPGKMLLRKMPSGKLPRRKNTPGKIAPLENCKK